MNRGIILLVIIVLFPGCGATSQAIPADTMQVGPAGNSIDSDFYRIGPGDVLEVFVWRNPEISSTVPVRPDGKVSTPLVEDMVAVGKTPTELARDMEDILSKYIKTPSVNVIVKQFQGTFSEQVRVVGQAVSPRAVQYREGMTLLDLMIAVGGLSQFAAGNRAKLVRTIEGSPVEYEVRLSDLLNKGDISQNLEIQPGDILIIPEAYF